MNIDTINEVLKPLSLLERLNKIREDWGDSAGMTSAFGYSGMILMHYVKKYYPELSIYFIDTGFHYPETMEFVNRVKSEWNLDIQIIKTRRSEEEINGLIGPEAYKKDPNSCCEIRKVEPLLYVLNTKKIWISALRRDQATSREQLPCIEYDARGPLKVYPMVDWKRADCWSFIKLNDISYHPMHDSNYPSIGCLHCTSPVLDGQTERSGRWNSFPEKLECGIHNHKQVTTDKH